MPTLSHGSDLRLAPTLGPITQACGGDPRAGLARTAQLGFTVVQLDAAIPGIRPRELDRSARRDLASTIRRSGLTPAGIDLFIPTDHYSNSEHLDRATHAVLGACSLAADLGQVPLSLNLATQQADAAMIDALLSEADRLGVPLVICDSAAEVTELRAWLEQHAHAPIGAGVDPAALLISRTDPSQSIQSLGPMLTGARLSDASRGQADAGRVKPGTGDLDLLAYRVGIDLAPSCSGPVVLDLRGLADPLAAARSAQSAWDRAAMHL